MADLRCVALRRAEPVEGSSPAAGHPCESKAGCADAHPMVAERHTPTLERRVVEEIGAAHGEDGGDEGVPPGEARHEVFEHVDQLEQGQSEKCDDCKVIHVQPPDERVVVLPSSTSTAPPPNR